ncbi:MAG: DUF3552 domain-containing protein, partial [Candidatus Latescibacteria bacterium]|nr:DUF3552 domain-containing protein [Candidatus Latescibacterota bacterium]
MSSGIITLWPFFVVLSAVVAFVVGWWVNDRVRQGKIADSETFAEKIVSDATKEAASIRERATLESENEWHKAREKFEADTTGKRDELAKFEVRLMDRERKLDKKVDLLSTKERGVRHRERELSSREKSVQAKDAQLSEMIQEQNIRLERIAGMRSEEAKSLLMRNLEQKAKQEAAQRAKEIKDLAVSEAEKEA